MKKLVLFVSLLLCGLVANGQVEGIESYSSSNADTVYDENSRIFIEFTKCNNMDSLFLYLVFDEVEDYIYSKSLSLSRGLFVRKLTNTTFLFHLHPSIESFTITGKSSGRIYSFEPMPKPVYVNDLSLTSASNDTLTFCSIFGSPEISPLYSDLYSIKGGDIFTKDLDAYLMINNNKISEKRSYNLDVKTGDILRVERLKSKKKDVNGCLIEQLIDTLKSKNYYIKLENNIIREGLSIKKGNALICPKDSVEISKSFTDNSYMWYKNYFSNKNQYSYGSEILVTSPGVFAYTKYFNLPPTSCPPTTTPIVIKSDVNCDGYIGGVVMDRFSSMPLAEVRVITNSGRVTLSDEYGKYYFKGKYEELNVINKIEISDTNYYYVVREFDNNDDYIFLPNLNIFTYRKAEKDLIIHLNSIRNRPGFTIPYYVSIHNRGINPLTANVSLILDDNLTYTSQSGENKPTTASGQTLTWENITVESGATKRLTFYAILDRKTPLGTELVSTAELIMAAPDDVPENDKTTFKTIVSGSFDPNDKLVTYAGAFTEGYVYDTTSFEYTIRFQNTGTDTAFTVRIEDVISKNLDLTTINFIDASHEFTPSISGDTVKWLFENILLADSNTNEPASHGFVRFSIDQKTGNIAGTEIKNKAAIYFDFNDPVITNEIVSTVNNDIVTELEHEISYQTQGIVSTYPNPARTSISINADGNGNFELYNAIGSQVLKTREKENINIESLKSGVYYYQFITNEKTVSGSFVKE